MGLREQVYRADKEAREGEGPAEQEGLRRLPNMALLSGTSLLPCLISQPLSQPDDCNCSGAQGAWSHLVSSIDLGEGRGRGGGEGLTLVQRFSETN